MKKVLFIPVSSEKGIGEYIRSIIIAENLRKNHPEVSIAFVLNENAPYYQSCPYQTYACSTSPTKDSKKVISSINDFSPDLVIFDASGRVSQLKHCQSKKIKTLFIAQHERKLKRGLGWRRLKYIDYICIVQPQFMLPPLSLWDKLKIRMLKKTPPLYSGPVFAEPQEEALTAFLQQFNLKKNSYILFNAGSGGHIKDGINAVTEFGQAASRVNKKTDLTCVLVLGPSYNGPSIQDDSITVIPSANPDQFNGLIRNCSAAVLAGGGALLYGIQQQKKIVACALSNDQPYRLKRCAEAGFAVPSPLNAGIIADRLINLISEPEKPYNAQIQNGVASISTTIENLLNTP